MVQIVIPENPLIDYDIARELMPRTFEPVFAKRDGPDFEAALKDAQFVVGFPDNKMNDAFYKAAPKLKLLQLVSAGYDQIDIEAARRAGVPVCSNGGANANSVAEHAILLMLAVSRRLVWQHNSVASGRWRGNDVAGVKLYDLRGRTLGLLGFGPIGRRTASIAQGFGMNVVYFDVARLSEHEADAAGVRFALFDELLRISDIVSLHVPLIPATRHMIGPEQLKMMKRSAILINTCRGPVVDEKALTAALSDGVIAGAGLDVFDPEPPAPDNPLLALPNVVLTPHFAGPTVDSQYVRFRNAFDNCERVLRGSKPLWIIPELAR